MKTLILMRHTKAEAHTPSVEDYDRSLAPRGQRAAEALGTWLREQDLVPEIALVSGAQRTEETWEALDLEADTGVKLLPELYDAVPSTILNLLAKLESDSALVVGHNPTMAMLTEHLLGDVEPPTALSEYPTGFTVALTFDGDTWDSALKSPGRLRAWTVPRDLTD